MALKLSIGTPVVTMDPVAHGPWEENCRRSKSWPRIAEAADRLGYHHLTCSEHIALPAAELARRGSRYWDPLATFGYLAARTSQSALPPVCWFSGITIRSRLPSVTARWTR